MKIYKKHDAFIKKFYVSLRKSIFQVVYQTGQVPLFHRYFRFYQSFGQTSPAPSEPIPRVASQSPQTTTTSSTAPIITQ